MKDKTFYAVLIAIIFAVIMSQESDAAVSLIPSTTADFLDKFEDQVQVTKGLQERCKFSSTMDGEMTGVCFSYHVNMIELRKIKIKLNWLQKNTEGWYSLIAENSEWYNAFVRYDNIIISDKMINNSYDL